VLTQQSIYWIALIIAVASNVTSNISLKIAMSEISPTSEKATLLQIIELKSFWIGIFFAGALLCSYLFAIRTLPVSIAYAVVTSLAMVGLLIMERVIFGTTIDTTKLIGIALVIAGVFLLTRTV
jgi:multidrug transporter EmrE-like cation transporter